MKIQDAQLNFFESKEQYLNFRQAWKDTINNAEPGYGPDCYHHMIYALLRGRDLNKMFSRCNRGHGYHPYFAFENAKARLSLAVSIPSYAKRALEPFGDTIPDDTLRSLHEIIREWKFEEDAK